MSQRLKPIGSFRVIVSSLPNFANNLSKLIHKIKL